MTVLERLKELERYKRLGQDSVYTQNCRRELIDNALPHLIAVAEAQIEMDAATGYDFHPPDNWGELVAKKKASLAELTKGAGDER